MTAKRTRPARTIHYVDHESNRNGRKVRTLCGSWTADPKDTQGTVTCPTCLKVQASIEQCDPGSVEEMEHA